MIENGSWRVKALLELYTYTLRHKVQAQPL